MPNPQPQVFMQRCFDLARLGAGKVAPNPMVGAVLVYEGRIIGEGWHKEHGKAHAEVNAVNSVPKNKRHLVKKSTLYVSLEPCNIYGKTPPCTDLILKEGIKKVVIACIDQTPNVRGEGIERLKEHGVEVVQGILEKQGQRISAFRNTWASKNRPFIQLKYAQSQNGYMGIPNEQIWISNAFSKRLSHKMRSEFDAILIGTQTALIDNPDLTNRHWYGQSPLRIVLDRNLKIPNSYSIFKGNAQTIVFTEKKSPQSTTADEYITLPFNGQLLDSILDILAKRQITSLLVEGGASTHHNFIKKNLWDEAYVITGKKIIENGLPAPYIFGEVIVEQELAGDRLTIFKNTH